MDLLDLFPLTVPQETLETGNVYEDRLCGQRNKVDSIATPTILEKFALFTNRLDGACAVPADAIRCRLGLSISILLHIKLRVIYHNAK